VDRDITRDDIIVIKNRFPEANVILAGEKPADAPVKEEKGDLREYGDRRATEIAKEVNLNVLSKNPVFLARIHLREMNLSKMNQILLDFDLSSMEAEYILSFIGTMLKREKNDEEIRKNRAKLEVLRDSFRFYIALFSKQNEEVRKIIEEIDDANRIASFNTYIAKMKLLYPGEEDHLLYTDYENLLWEKKLVLQKK
jgi:hypothetical protein